MSDRSYDLEMTELIQRFEPDMMDRDMMDRGMMDNSRYAGNAG